VSAQEREQRPDPLVPREPEDLDLPSQRMHRLLHAERRAELDLDHVCRRFLTQRLVDRGCAVARLDGHERDQASAEPPVMQEVREPRGRLRIAHLAREHEHAARVKRARTVGEAHGAGRAQGAELTRLRARLEQGCDAQGSLGVRYARRGRRDLPRAASQRGETERGQGGSQSDAPSLDP